MKRLIFILLLIPYTAFGLECRPETKGSAELKSQDNGIHYVVGKLSGFDPCNKSVKLSVPWSLFSSDKRKPPILIYLHGGGGLSRYGKMMLEDLNREGIATLEFDAYQMNGFDKDWKFWGFKASNASRQKMIFTVALSAYHWVKTLENVDTDRIYFYGISNGASVAVNLAGVVDKQKVKKIYAEGMPGMGLGLPDTINVPVKLIYGKLDDYGSRNPGEMIWERTAPCFFNTVHSTAPEGNSKNCNDKKNSLDRTEKPIDWFGRMKEKYPIELEFYEDAAHGIILGDLQKRKSTYGHSIQANTSIGASRDAKDKLLKSLVKEIRSP